MKAEKEGTDTMTLKNISAKKRKGTAAIAAAIITASMIAPLTFSDSAFAATETRTFTWQNGESQPVIPQTITGANGQVMTLTSQTQPVQAGQGGQQSQNFTRTVSSTCSPNQVGNLAGMVPVSLHIEENGYSGDIPRTAINYAPIYRTDSKDLSGTQSRSASTEQAAIAALPQTMTQAGYTLHLTSSSAVVSMKASDGTPLMYTATGQYTAQVQQQVLDHYNVDTSYSGTLTKNVNNGSWSLSAVYTSPDDPNANNENVVPPADPNANNENANNENAALNANSNANGNKNANGSNGNTNKNGNNPDSGNGNGEEKKDGLPIIPIGIGVGVVALAGIIAAVIAANRKKKKGAAQPTDAGTVAAGAVAGAAAAAPVEEEPESQCQLVEVVPFVAGVDENGEEVIDFNQEPKANLDVFPSLREDIPTFAYLPSTETEDGERIIFTPEEGAQYWIAIDDDSVERAVSKDVIIASDDLNEVYRGSLIEEDGTLTSQMLLDTECLTNALNGTFAEEDAKNIADELDAYEEARETILEERRTAAEAAAVASAAAATAAAASETDEFADADMDASGAAEAVENDMNAQPVDAVDDFDGQMDSVQVQEHDDFTDVDTSEKEEPVRKKKVHPEDEQYEVPDFMIEPQQEPEKLTDFEREMDDYNDFQYVGEPDVDGVYVNSEQDMPVFEDKPASEPASDPAPAPQPASQLADDLNFDDFDDALNNIK